MKKTVGKKQKKKTYDAEFKNLVVREYLNTNKASETARKYGVARCTLLEWIKSYSTIETRDENVSNAAVIAIQDTSAAVVKSIESAAATRQEFLQQHFDGISQLFSAIITKMNDTLNDENKHPSLRDQAAALTALTNFIKEFTPAEDQGNISINLLQQTVNK